MCDRTGNLASASASRNPTFIRVAKSREERFKIDSKSLDISDSGSFGSACSHRGDHCLIDANMIEITGPGEVFVASPLSLLEPEGDAFLSLSHLVKPKNEWPSISALKSKRVHCCLKHFQYHILLKRPLEARMVTLLNCCDVLMERSMFGVWKKVGVSQRLIWARNRSNLLFLKEDRSVELPTPTASPQCF